MEGFILRKWIVFLIVFLMVFGVAFSEEESYLIQGIAFQGLKNVSYDMIQDLINIKIFNSYSRDSIEKELEKLRNSGYFKSVNYQLRKLDLGYELVINVEEYPLISNIIVPNLKLVSKEEIMNVISSKEKTFFSENKALEDCNRIKKYYQSKGYILKEEPTFSFKDNSLIFNWEEAPPIGKIEIKAKNAWEESLIKSYLKLSIGDYVNLNKINDLNIILNKKNIKIKVVPKWDFENDYTILSLELVYLPSKEVTLNYEYNKIVGLSLGIFTNNSGYWKFYGNSDLSGNIDYGLEWQRNNMRLALNNKEVLINIKRQISEVLDIDGEIGIKENFVAKDRALVFSIVQDRLIKEGDFIESGKYFKIGLDFHGGGSLYNYSMLSFLGKYYLSYGEGLERRIVGVEGVIKYPIGESPESGCFNLKVYYTIPLENKVYLSLGLGGDSSFIPQNVSSLSDLKFNILGSLGMYYSKSFVNYNIGMESNFVDIFNFYVKMKFIF